MLHVPRIASNLLSVHKLCLDNNCSCYFDAKKFSIQDLPTGRILYKGLSNNGVYPIQSPMFIPATNKTACAAHSISSDKWHLWHSRLGHPSDKVLANVFPCFSPNSSSKDVKVHCHHCLAGKMHQLPFPTSNKTVTSPFELVHADLWVLHLLLLLIPSGFILCLWMNLPSSLGFTYSKINLMLFKCLLNLNL